MCPTIALPYELAGNCNIPHRESLFHGQLTALKQSLITGTSIALGALSRTKEIVATGLYQTADKIDAMVDYAALTAGAILQPRMRLALGLMAANMLPAIASDGLNLNAMYAPLQPPVGQSALTLQAEPTPCPPYIHTVRRDETMYAIARIYGVNPNALIAANSLIGDPDAIYPGDLINVPGECATENSSPTSTPAPTPTQFPLFTTSPSGTMGSGANPAAGAANAVGGGGIPEGVRPLDTRGLFTMLTVLGGLIVVALTAGGFYTLAARGNQFLHPQKKEVSNVA